MIEQRLSGDGKYELRASQWLPRQPSQLFHFFSDCRHMNQVVPSWLQFQIVRAHEGPMQPGASYEYVIRWHWARLRWHTRITACDPPHRFVDVQQRGPYRFFEHEHLFVPAGGGTLTWDIIRYLPPGRIISPLTNRWVSRDLVRLFEHRHRRMAELFSTEQASSVERQS